MKYATEYALGAIIIMSGLLLLNPILNRVADAVWSVAYAAGS